MKNLPCNLGDDVTPNHFCAADFVPFAGLSIEREFDLVAPVFIYFEADLAFKEQARSACRELKALGHPLMEGVSVSEVLEQAAGLNGLSARYNALMMAFVDSVIPNCESYIDKWGAYSFRVEDDETLLAGDASGTFAFYSNAQAVKERLKEANVTATS